MAIRYAMVARGSVVLAEYSSSSSNASLVARQILEELPPGTDDTNLSYTQVQGVFHVTREDGLTFLCMADGTFGNRIPFAFLKDIHSSFVKAYGDTTQTALAYAMNNEFSRVLNQQMDYYSNNPNADPINRMKSGLNQVQNVMLGNIDKVLDRGERLELLLDKSSDIRSSSFKFRKQAREYHNALWWRNCKLVLLFILILLMVVYIVLAIVCGGVTLLSCR